MDNAETVAMFTGRLRQFKQLPGRSLVQLVFREDDTDWLCISADPSMTQLKVGKPYRIEGVFRSIGNQSYIHQPIIEPIRRKGVAQYWGAGILTVAALALVGIFIFPGMPHTASQSIPTVVKPTANVTSTRVTQSAPQTEATTSSAATIPVAVSASNTQTTKKTSTTIPPITSPTNITPAPLTVADTPTAATQDTTTLEVPVSDTTNTPEPPITVPDIPTSPPQNP